MQHWLSRDYNRNRAQSKIRKVGAEEGYDLKQTKHKEKKNYKKYLSCLTTVKSKVQLFLRKSGLRKT
jgi:hypothetical protein